MVHIAPEDHDPANWKSWLEDGDGKLNEEELPWYGISDDSPSYGPDAPPAAQIEAARRFVSHWLNEDAHEFVIPGGEWGRSLMHWLHILVARPAEDGRNPEPASAPDSGRAEPHQPEVETAEAEATEEAPKLTLVEQVRSRDMKAWRWVDALSWEYEKFLEWGYIRNDIDEALKLALKLSAEDDRAEQVQTTEENS